MSRFFSGGLVSALLATSALAAGPGTDNTFTVDPALSSITFSIVGIGTAGVSPMVGTFVLNMADPAGGVWNVETEMEDVDAVSIADLNFGSLFINGMIAAGDFGLLDWDSWDPDSEIFPGLDGDPLINDINDQPDVPPNGTANTTLANGPAISDGQIITDVFVLAFGSLSIFGDVDPFGLIEWAVPVDGVTFQPTPWTVQVADDDSLGVTVAGNTEAHVFVTAFVPTGDPFADPVIQLDIDLWGATDFVGGATPPGLDIKPGSCPNPYNRKSQGKLPVALLGTSDFDVANVDPATLLLARADGVGGSVAPLQGPPGPGNEIGDSGTPFDGDPCGCHELDGDGTDDLNMKFSRPDLTATLQLNDLARGAYAELVLSGSLLDGTPFAASDCIKIVPGGDVDSDLDVDADDFLTFSNCYNGSLNLPRPACPPYSEADIDGDGDVDATDFLTFSNCYNGSLNPAACN